MFSAFRVRIKSSQPGTKLFFSQRGNVHREGGDRPVHKGGGGGVKERGRPAHRRERGTYPLSGLLHTKGDDRERGGGRESCTQKRGGKLPLRGLLHTKRDEGGGGGGGVLYTEERGGTTH